MKPIAIYVLKNLPPLVPEIINQFNITGQGYGWINGSIFKNNIQYGFVEKINKLRAFDGNSDEPLLTIFDHHTSRDILDPKALWKSHKIVLFVLPPHSYALTQPLDFSCNGDPGEAIYRSIK